MSRSPGSSRLNRDGTSPSATRARPGRGRMWVLVDVFDATHVAGMAPLLRFEAPAG